MRLNEVILSIKHADRVGFMPYKSTALNLRRLFLNMQTPLDNMGQHALLSLDANKVFNSLERQYLWAVLTKFGFGEKFIKWF